MFSDCSHIVVVTTDLFDMPPIPGLHSRADFLTPVEEGALIAAIGAIELTPFQFQQWTGKRLTHSFGWQYDFQLGELGRGAPMPDWLLPKPIIRPPRVVAVLNQTLKVNAWGFVTVSDVLTKSFVPST